MADLVQGDRRTAILVRLGVDQRRLFDDLEQPGDLFLWLRICFTNVDS